MDSKELDLIRSGVANDFNLRKLYQEHEKYEAELARFANKSFLTPSEEMEVKRLKKEKLLGKEQMLKIVMER